MYVLGIHPDGDYFKVALLSNAGRKIRIVFLQEFKKDILDLNQLKRRILKETKYKHESVEVVSALTPDEVFVKKISFPFVKKGSIMKALPFQIEKLLPFSEEHVTTVAQIKAKKRESDVTLYTFFNETLQTHLHDIKTLGFDSDSVSTVSKGLLRFKKFFVSDLERAVLLYFGWEKSYLIYVDAEEVKHSLVIEVGFRQLIDAAREDHPGVKEIDFGFLKEEVAKYFQRAPGSLQTKAVLNHFQKGLFRAFEYIKKKEKREQLDVVHLGYSSISEEMLCFMSEIETKSIEISPHLEFDRQQLRSYAIEIGLSLDCLERGKNALQLRTGEFTSPKQLGKVKRKIKLLFGLSIVCSLVTFVLTTIFFIKKETLIRERFNYIVTLGGEDPSSYVGLQKMLFSPKQFQKEADTFLEKTRWHKQEGIFLKEPMLVTECLQELSSLFTKETVLEDIQYELLTYPTVEKPKEGYQVKLAFSIKSTSMEEAKRVFEEFVKKNKAPLAQKSLEWVKEKNVYQMVFVFKQQR